jgi:hypothetical protein
LASPRIARACASISSGTRIRPHSSARHHPLATDSSSANCCSARRISLSKFPSFDRSPQLSPWCFELRTGNCRRRPRCATPGLSMLAAVGSRRHKTDIGALRVDQLFEQLCLTFESLFLLHNDSDRDFAARQLRRRGHAHRQHSVIVMVAGLYLVTLHTGQNHMVHASRSDSRRRRTLQIPATPAA